MRRWIAAALLLAGACTQVAAQEAVRFASLDGTELNAWLFKPAADVKATVVALHGCGGLYATRGPRTGQLAARHQAMADLLVEQGYAVVFPDSLTPRGEQQLCTQRLGTRRIDQRQRRADALAAVNWVAAQAWAAPSRVALLGWSHGGSAVLAATDATREDVRSQPARAAVAIAFYPGCTAFQNAGYEPATRLVLMLGDRDDWTPPGPCVALGRRVRAEVHVFPDAYHGFDEPVGQVRLRRDVPLNDGAGVHVGPNPQAREAAYRRLRELLAEVFR